MKIAFFINHLGPGGAERAISGLANHWITDHQIEIITFVKSTPFYELNSKVSLKYCLEKPKNHNSRIRSKFDSISRFKKLFQHLNSFKPDVLISFMHTANIYALWSCRILNIPCIISERSNHAIDTIPNTHILLRNLSYPLSASLVVQTKGNQAYYTQIMKLNKIAIIPNAIATDLKDGRKLNDSSKKKYILNVGSFKNGKSQDILIRAFANLPISDWQLIFLGDGPNLEKQKHLAHSLGIGEQILFAGAQKDVASYYNKASMFVFTSEHEGFPNALLEALYFGVPSISSNCPHGPADMITDGENGFLVPVGDVSALSKKMTILMENEALRNSFRKKALESTKKYEMEPIAKQWMNLIESVVVTETN